MIYTLALLTHGTARTFSRTVESFTENVTPAPDHVRVFADGVTAIPYSHVTGAASERFGDKVRCSATHPDRRLGFCEATRRLWTSAADSGPEFVFWLEADFVFLRKVDLRDLADVLAPRRVLAQMALIRDVANAEEAAAGGLVASRPGEFAAHETHGHQWMSQQSYFTTTPSLMMSSFMREQPFLDDGQPFCEGRYGASLLDLGFQFGAWGHGEEWVAHMGSRVENPGHGY